MKKILSKPLCSVSFILFQDIHNHVCSELKKSHDTSTSVVPEGALLLTGTGPGAMVTTVDVALATSDTSAITSEVLDGAQIMVDNEPMEYMCITIPESEIKLEESEIKLQGSESKLDEAGVTMYYESV